MDASNYDGNSVLVGNSSNNTIKASEGGSILWGGSGNTNDSLIAGDGDDTFVYLADNGNDTISGVTEDDLIILGNEGLTGISTTSDRIVMTYGANSLTVLSNNSGVGFQINGVVITCDQTATENQWSVKQ